MQRWDEAKTFFSHTVIWKENFATLSSFFLDVAKPTHQPSIQLMTQTIGLLLILPLIYLFTGNFNLEVCMYSW